MTAFAAVSWLILFTVYLKSVPGTFYFEDSPELIAAAATLGNTHPPGYPLLVMAGKLAQSVPVGAPAFRFNLLIAACAAGAAACLGIICLRLCEALWSGRSGRDCLLALGASVLAGGAWGFSDSFWWEAVIGDKYAPFYLLFMGSVLASIEALVCSPSRYPRACALAGASAGLSVAYHHYGVFVLPIALLALGRGLFRGAGIAPSAGRRAVALALFLAVIPPAAETLFPPMRSAGAAELDWGMPRRFSRLLPYLEGKLYHQSFRPVPSSEAGNRIGDRISLAALLLREEIPLVFFLGLPVGIVALARFSKGLACGILLCAFVDAGYAFNFTEKIVRWYEPAYGILLVLSSLGFAHAVRRVGHKGVAVVFLAAISGTGWQFARGLERNELSSCAAAHDFARNLLRSLPENSVYLGAGDFDLFPLWAMRYGEGERRDVDATGLAAFADPFLAGSGNQERLMASLGLRHGQADTIPRLLEGGFGRPVVLAATGYDRRLYERMPILEICRIRGLTGRFAKAWDPAGSYDRTVEIERVYTYRGLSYARSGGVFDMSRVRDEVTRAALLHYPLCLAVVGRQCLSFGLIREAAWAYGEARRLMEAIVGPLPASPVGENDPSLEKARLSQMAVALGCQRLADVFAARGVEGLAAGYAANARALSQ